MTETGSPPPPEPAETADGPRFIRSLRLTNLLSFGPAGEEIELRSLNVLVGANGSGKTNFIEALGLLAACPVDMSEPIRKGGGINSWINFKAKNPEFGLEVHATRRPDAVVLAHSLLIGNDHLRPSMLREMIYSGSADTGQDSLGIVYAQNVGDQTVLDDLEGMRILHDRSDQRQSALAILKDSQRYPEIAHLQRLYGSIRLYRNWTFGPNSPLRRPQATDLPSEWLEEDYSNLFLILNQLDFKFEVKTEMLQRLRDVLPDVTDYKLQIIGGTILLFLMEGRQPVGTMRLSDGTLRWLCLLAILIAPSPPGVIVLEEPELGLHPDMINTLADMLKQAATHHQLVVTTHSDILIDALSDVPEAVMVVEKEKFGTTVRRLNAKKLKPWLDEYRLGRLWMKGQIGGTRW